MRLAFEKEDKMTIEKFAMLWLSFVGAVYVFWIATKIALWVLPA